MDWPDVDFIRTFYIHIGCQGVFIVLLAVCLWTGWLGGSQRYLKDKKSLNKFQILKIRAVFGKRRVQLKRLVTNVIIDMALQNIARRQKMLKGYFLTI